ncbi:MAG: NAD-dependent epimerase/dehydratase family protein [Bacteroidetes bacterium]|nr:NAD-dependent epimerase/dehydratase family protein [Bacteroidota bacterium]
MHIRKRILVTGGAGFLGAHLCKRLLTICVSRWLVSSMLTVPICILMTAEWSATS